MITLEKSVKSFTLFTVVLTLAATLTATELYVATDGNHTTGDGWANAFTNLQSALGAATKGDTIYLKGEEFVATNQITWLQGDNLLIRGGYEGVGTPGGHDPQRWPTKLLLAPGYESRVLYAENIAGGTVEHVTIANGNAKGATMGAGGGGICISNAFSMILRNCTITNNSAETHGGGVTLIGQPGAMAGPVILDTCLVASNRLDTDSSTKAYGGGIYLYYLTGSMITNCQIVGNSVKSKNNTHGGGFATVRSIVTIVDCFVSRNEVLSYAVGGGGYMGTGGGVSIYETIFSYNRCYGGRVGGGGGLYGDAEYGKTYRNLLIYSNECSGTQSAFAGGFYSKPGGGHTFDNCTIVDNVPSGMHRGYSSAVFNLKNCILWGNQGVDFVDTLDPGMNNIKPVHCNIESGLNQGADGTISLDPQFKRPERGDYSLRSSSPCRETGVALPWHTTTPRDLVGNPRVIPPSGKVDMGALEGLLLGATSIMIR